MKTEYLLQKEVNQVLSALMPDNARVLRVMLHNGLRVGDVVSLKTDQLAPRFWIREQKTGKAKQVGLPADLLSDLRFHAGKTWVFPGRDPAKHRTRQAVWKDVKRAAAAFRLKQNVGTHSARKVYAVELLHRYGDIDRVRRALNHSNEMVTLIYALADMQLQAKRPKRRKRS